jgi:hypothetical protein
LASGKTAILSFGKLEREFGNLMQSSFAARDNKIFVASREFNRKYLFWIQTYFAMAYSRMYV